MREPDRNDPQHGTRHRRAQPAGPACALLQVIPEIFGPEDAAHQRHSDHATGQPKHQKGGQFHVELQGGVIGQRKFGDPAKFDPVDHGACHRRNHDGGKGVHRKVAQNHLKREKGARDGRIKAGRHRRRNGTAQQVAPGDPIGVDPAADPGRDHPGHMHHRPFPPRGPPRAQCDQRRKRRGDPGPRFHPSIMQCCAKDHVRHRSRPRIMGEVVQDDTHHQSPECRDQDHPIPLQPAEKAVQRIDILGSINTGL